MSSAIAREPRARFDGRVAGVGLEPDGVRIETNRRARPALSGLALETALAYLGCPTHVTGYLAYERDRTVL